MSAPEPYAEGNIHTCINFISSRITRANIFETLHLRMRMKSYCFINFSEYLKIAHKQSHLFVSETKTKLNLTAMTGM